MEAENAMLARAEIGDFSRFKSGRKVSCWLDTVPTDGSSGGNGRHGKITKAGDKYLRRALEDYRIEFECGVRNPEELAVGNYARAWSAAQY